MSQRVLVIGWVWPEPKSSAAGHNMLSLVRTFLARQWQVDFACCAEPTPLSFPLESLGVARHTIKVNDSSFNDWLACLKPDIVVFDRFLMEEQFGWRVAQVLPNALRILDTEDLQGLRLARHQALKAGREYQTGDLLNDVCLREIASIWRSDLCLIVSQTEQQLLLQRFNLDKSLLYYWPLQPSKDSEITPLAEDQLPAFEQRSGFVTIGNFRHEPNWDSVRYLRELWPQVRHRLPAATLDIYGAYLPPKARQLHDEKSGFRVLGWVEDARLALASARVCVAPLRFGAGQKGKLLLAMCAGTPSVTTPLGAESMVSAGSWPGAIATESSQLVEAMVTLHEQSDQWRQAQDSGFAWLRRLARQDYGRGLIERIETLLGDIDSHRQSNFTGAMLRHHQHKSTEYFSRWIETKNRLPQGDDS